LLSLHALSKLIVQDIYDRITCTWRGSAFSV